MVRISCPKCKTIFVIDEKLAGPPVICQNCNSSLRFNKPSSPIQKTPTAISPPPIPIPTNTQGIKDLNSKNSQAPKQNFASTAKEFLAKGYLTTKSKLQSKETVEKLAKAKSYWGQTKLHIKITAITCILIVGSLFIWMLSSKSANQNTATATNTKNSTSDSKSGLGSNSSTDLNKPIAIKYDNKKLPASALKEKSWAFSNKLERKSPHAIALSPDGKTLAITDSSLKLLDTKTGKEKAMLEEKTPAGTALAISPDGKYLAYSADMRSTIKLYELDQLNIVKEIENPYIGIPTVPIANGAKTYSMRSSLAFSFDNKYLVTAGHTQKTKTPSNKSSTKKKEANDELVIIWNRETLKQEQKIQGEEPLSCAAKSPFMAFRGKNSSEAYVWNTDTKQEIAKIETQATGVFQGKPTELTKIESLALSPDGSLLAVVVRLGDDGTKIANFQNQIQLWDVSKKTKLKVAYGFDNDYDDIISISFLPVGSTLAIAGDLRVDGATKQIGLIQLFDTKLNKTASLLGHDKKVNSLSFSSDGKLIASISQYSGNETNIWEEQTNSTGSFHYVDFIDEKKRLDLVAENYRAEQVNKKEIAKKNTETQDIARSEEMKKKYGSNPKGFTRKLLVATPEQLKNAKISSGQLKGAEAKYEPETVGDCLQATSLCIGSKLQGSRLREIGNAFASFGGINTPYSSWELFFGSPNVINNKPNTVDKWGINCKDGVVRFVGVLVPRDNSFTKALVVVHAVHWDNYIPEFCISR